MREIVRQAAAAQFAEQGWRQPPWRAIAEAAGTDLAGVRAVYPDVTAVLRDWHAEADRQMLSGLGPDETQGPDKDRLFALLMRRYDALMPYRPALHRLMRGPQPMPAHVVILAGDLHRSMLWALEAAGLSRGPLRNIAAAAALVAVHAANFGIWLDDPSEDMGSTMRGLDEKLTKALQFSDLLRRSKTLDGTGESAA